MPIKIKQALAEKKTKLANEKKEIENHPADFRNYEDGTFYQVEIKDIKTNPNQPRKYFNQKALQDLSNSIKEKGVLQPVIIAIDNDRQIRLVAGERRLRAAQMAGLEKIPARITKGIAAEIALIENIQREDLQPIEEAEAMEQMIKEFGYTQDELSQILGKARTTITEVLSLNKLSEEIKEKCRRADISKRTLVEIAKQKTPEAMLGLLEQTKQENLKSDGIRELTRKKRNKEQISQTPKTLLLGKKFVSQLKEIKNLNEVEKKELLDIQKELEGFLKNLNQPEEVEAIKF